MRDYIIATDSCCDFDENLIRELDLTVIPLSVHLGQDHFRNYPGEMPESHVFYTRPQRHLSKRCHGSGRAAGGVS